MKLPKELIQNIFLNIFLFIDIDIQLLVYSRFVLNNIKQKLQLHYYYYNKVNLFDGCSKLESLVCFCTGASTESLLYNKRDIILF